MYCIMKRTSPRKKAGYESETQWHGQFPPGLLANKSISLVAYIYIANFPEWMEGNLLYDFGIMRHMLVNNNNKAFAEGLVWKLYYLIFFPTCI